MNASPPKQIEGHVAKIGTNVNVGDKVTDIYFGAAFSTLVRLGHTDELHPHFCGSRVLEDVITVCVLLFLSLESAINLLFHETFVSSLRTINDSIPFQLVQHLKRTWQNNLSVKDKYLLLPPLVSDFTFDAGTPPFQLFAEFIKFRNRLVHAKAKTQKTTVQITDVDTNSTEGEVLEHHVETVTPEERFPLTRFATTFTSLARSDAEKAFEIMYKMRQALHKGTLCSPPYLLADVESGPFVSGDRISDEIRKLFAPHFGDLET